MAIDSLIDRMAAAIAAVDDEELTNMTWHLHARAAAQAAVEWIEEQDQVKQEEEPTHFDVPTSSDVMRWMRDEINNA